MSPTQIARVAGFLLIIVVVLLTVLLAKYDLVKLMESFTNLWFFIMGILLTAGIQLVFSPQRFLGIASKPISETKSRNTQAVLETEKTSFKNIIAKEVKIILEDNLRLSVSNYEYVPVSSINCIEWVRKTDDEKVRLIGLEAYYLLRSFYDRIDAFNETRTKKDIDFQTSKKLILDCFTALKRASERIDWLKDIVPETEPLPTPPKMQAPVIVKLSDREYFARFDETLEALKKATTPKTLSKMSEELQDRLADLPHSQIEVWDEQIRQRATEVLFYTHAQLRQGANLEHMKACLYFLAKIVGKDDPQTIRLIKKTFGEIIIAFYDDARFERNPDVIRLIQRLSDYDEKTMVMLIDDAVLKWSNDKFNDIARFIELDKIDEKVSQQIRDNLRKKMNEAEEKDEIARSRAETLYNRIRS